MTLSATDGTKVVGLARINSFRAFQYGGWIARETEGLEERLWILRPSERAGKKESRAKGRGTGRANRLSSRGLRELRPGITPVAFSSLPLPFFPLSAAYPSFATLIRFVPVTSIRDNTEFTQRFRSAFLSRVAKISLLHIDDRCRTDTLSDRSMVYNSVLLS